MNRPATVPLLHLLHLEGRAGDLLCAGAEAPAVVFQHPSAPAVVLGSTQPGSDVDRRQASVQGVDVVRRRSGGGAVMVGEGRALWVDVAIGRDDPRWLDDVGRAAWWVGEAWTAALDRIGVPGAEVWRGAPSRPAGRRVAERICFAGIGPGEVSIGGRKVVGISQRRGRGGALFQCAALLDADPAELVQLLCLPAAERSAAARALAATTTGLGSHLAPALVEAVASLLCRSPS